MFTHFLCFTSNVGRATGGDAFQAIAVRVDERRRLFQDLRNRSNAKAAALLRLSGDGGKLASAALRIQRHIESSKRRLGPV